jgi:hypothetical protein
VKVLLVSSDKHSRVKVQRDSLTSELRANLLNRRGKINVYGGMQIRAKRIDLEVHSCTLTPIDNPAILFSR